MPYQEEQMLLTVGEIARRLNQPVHRVEYLIRTRRRRPVARAGNLRVFTEEDIEWIAAELRRSSPEDSDA